MKRRRTAHRTAVALSAVVLVVGAAACNGDDDVATTVPDIPVPTTTDDTFLDTTTTDSVETTEPTIATTSAPPTSASPTTTAPPTTSPETTDAPPSTVADPEVQAVIDATVAAWSAFNEIKLDPFNDDKLNAVRMTRSGAGLDTALEFVEDFRLRGVRSMTNPQIPASIHPRPSTVFIESDSAVIEYCWVDSNVLVEPGGGADGELLVLDDSVTVSLDRETYEFVDGRWLKTGGIELRRMDGDTCDNFE